MMAGRAIEEQLSKRFRPTGSISGEHPNTSAGSRRASAPYSPPPRYIVPGLTCDAVEGSRETLVGPTAATLEECRHDRHDESQPLNLGPHGARYPPG